MTTTQQRTERERPLPEPDGDFYRITDALSEEDREFVRRVRSFMEERVQPVINGYWMRDEFPSSSSRR